MLPTFQRKVASMGLSDFLFDLLGLTGTKKQELLELQKLVVKDSPNRLIVSEKELVGTATAMITRDLKIVQDCVQIVNNTTKPDTFFYRLSLLEEKAQSLCAFEQFGNYIKFSVPPSAAFVDFSFSKQEAIRQFLIRYFFEIFDQARNLKTAKGKYNKYQKFYDSLQPYYEIMNDENIDYIETKYKAYTRDLTKALK